MKKKPETIKELRAAVEQEVGDHGKGWCSPNCQYFSSSAYREMRIVHGYSKEVVQKEYDFCHACR